MRQTQKEKRKEQSEQKFEKNCPILGNVAKTVAKLQKLEVKVENSSTKLLLDVKVNTKKIVFKLLFR